MPENAYLVLENGKIFQGKYFGIPKEAIGEIVFTTAMTGYLETLTDKSYYKQIVVQTFPLIGNYGINISDAESDKPEISAYIVKHLCEYPSNFRSEQTLNDYFVNNNLTGLYGIDTRALTKIIRENGVMNGKITSNIDKIDYKKIKDYTADNGIAAVSCKKMYSLKADDRKFKVAVMDFGLKESIKRELLKRGCDIYVFPYNSSAQEIMAVNPDGILLSSGPGDPADNYEVVKNVRELITYKLPMFGICLGHLILALANGFKTEKLKYGHRGENQPVKDLISGRTYISAQSHGYAVVRKSIDKRTAQEYYVNVNDDTNEGIEYKNLPAFSVQFHPEACGGPTDTNFLFDKFIKIMEAKKCR